MLNKAQYGLISNMYHRLPKALSVPERGHSEGGEWEDNCDLLADF